MDFDQGQDSIRINLGTVDAFSDLRMSYRNDDAIIRYETSVITVSDVSTGALPADDFIF